MWMKWRNEKMSDEWNWCDCGNSTIEEVQVNLKDYFEGVFSGTDMSQFTDPIDGGMDLDCDFVDYPPRSIIQGILSEAQDELKDLKRQIKSLESQLKKAKD